MIIWKLLVSECLQCVKKPTNEVDKNTAAVVRTNLKEEVVGRVQQKFSMIVSMFLSLLHCVLDIFATRKRVNHGGEYGPEVTGNFHFSGPEKAFKLPNKDRKNAKDCLEESLHKSITRKVFCYRVCPLLRRQL